jgi:hypothetical protein
MRVTSFVAAAFVLVLAGSVFAQEPWAESSSPRDGFRITFPGTPKVEEVTWTSQMGYPLPARVFTVDRGREHYSVTVADSRGIENSESRSTVVHARHRDLHRRPDCQRQRGAVR